MQWKQIVDGVMFALLLNQMAYVLTGQKVHEWTGTVMVLLVICHNLLNRRWYGAIGKGTYHSRRLIGTILNVLLIVIMLGLFISGIVMSRYAFDFIPIRGGRALARRVHIFSAYWGFVLMTVHIGVHWKGIKGNVCRKFGKAGLDGTRKQLISGIGWAVSAYGLYAGYRHEIFSFLLLQNEFAMFLEQSVFEFILDYLAMVVLIIKLVDYLCGRKG